MLLSKMYAVKSVFLMGTMPNCYLALGLIVTTKKHLELGMWNWHELGLKYSYTFCVKSMYVNSKHSDSVERFFLHKQNPCVSRPNNFFTKVGWSNNNNNSTVIDAHAWKFAQHALWVLSGAPCLCWAKWLITNWGMA